MAKLITKTTRTPEVNDYFYISSNDGLTDGKVELQDMAVIPETTRNINFTSSQTAAQIQAEIDAVGRYIPVNVNLTFQFGNGTYTLDNQLLFQGFYGGGNIQIYGDTSQTDALHTNHNVHLNFNNDTHGIYILKCAMKNIRLKHLKITTDNAKSSIIGQRLKWIEVQYNYCISTAKGSSSTRSIYILDGTDGRTDYNYISGSYYGIHSSICAHISSNNNDDTGTQPTVGLRADGNGIIGKLGASQPTGSITNEATRQGGEIR